MTTLIIRHPDGSQTEQELADQLTVGRSEGNDLILSEGGVSRKHARFFIEGAAVMVEDVGSANGTFVDGEAINEAVPLSAQAQVIIGDYEISLKPKPKPKAKTSAQRAAPRAKSPSVAAAPSTRAVQAVKPSDRGAALARKSKAASSSAPTLKAVNGPLEGQAIKVEGLMVVGRVASVDLQIEDDSVSRRHAELNVVRGQVVVKDLGSANGTAVNGEPIEEETTLAAGDLVQFGTIEFVFESSAGRAKEAAGAAAPRGRAPRGAVRNAARPDYDDEVARKKKLLLGAAVAVGLVVVLVVVAAVVRQPATSVEAGAATVDSGPVDECADEQVEQWLIEGRSCLESEKWGCSDEALRKVLACAPFNDEAAKLTERVKTDKACVDALNRGKKEAALHRWQEGLDAFSRVTPKCSNRYFLQALELAKDPASELMKENEGDCRRFAKDKNYKLMKKHCEEWLRLACQTWEPSQINPPPGYKVRLESGKLKEGQWRPSNSLQLHFWVARSKLGEGTGAWECPELSVLRLPTAPKQANVCEEFGTRYPAPAFGEALCLYYQGKPITTFSGPLQKRVIESRDSKMEPLLEKAREMIKDLSLAYNEFESGQTAVQNGDLKKAAEWYESALRHDAELVLGPGFKGDSRRALERLASYVRRTSMETMGSAAYTKGKEYADRNDWRKACETWKLGHLISKNHLDLLRAITNCSPRAKDAFERAQTCVEFKLVLSFAVDGDGWKDQVIAATEKMDCQLDL
jgi:ABC transport system ATP-binding/permease protein